MTELLKTIRALGWSQAWDLYRGYRLGWVGILSGYFTTRTLQTLFNVGLFDEIKAHGSVDVDAFAAEKNLDRDILRSLCDSLYSLSILKKQGSRYSLEEKGRLLNDVARGWFEGVYGYEGIFHELEALLRKKKEFGRDLTRRGDFVARGSGEMEKWIFFPMVAEVVKRNHFRKVLDLGCGEGTFLRSLCQSDPDVRAYGVDLAPDAIAEGMERAKAAGLQDRVQLFVEDISKLEKLRSRVAEIDMATVFFVLHEVLFRGADATVELLRSFRNAYPGVPLVVFEVVRPSAEEMRRRPGMAIQYVLQHDLTHQKLVGLEEWKELFRKAGFSRIDQRHLRFTRTAMFTVS
jgi:ubiquinone/menaquinone biosynthesis C-methylase UbiE